MPPDLNFSEKMNLYHPIISGRERKDATIAKAAGIQAVYLYDFEKRTFGQVAHGDDPSAVAVGIVAGGLIDGVPDEVGALSAKAAGIWIRSFFRTKNTAGQVIGNAVEMFHGIIGDFLLFFGCNVFET